jgi:RNA polymerase sigma-B factor
MAAKEQVAGSSDARERARRADLLQELRQYRRTGERAIRDRVIESHIVLVEQLARRFLNRGEPFDDLVQAGSIGLVKAVDGFDPELGFEFSAYASTTIIGELKRHFRDKGWSVRAPRRIQELYLRIGQASGDLSQQLGRSPTVQELAEDTDSSPEDVLEALEAAHALRANSLDTPSAEGDTLGSRLGSEDSAFERSESRVLLERQLAALDEREQAIIRMRFFEDLTQAEIATRIGMSQMHVSRLLARSLRRLQEVCGPVG